MKAIESREVIPAFCSEARARTLLQRTQQTQNFEGDGESPTSDKLGFQRSHRSRAAFLLGDGAIVCSYVLQRFPRLQD